MYSGPQINRGGSMASRSALKEIWEFKLKQWGNSGLNAAMWCREQNIKYCVFLYWKRKLRTAESTSTQFLELVEPLKETAGIEIEVRGFLVRLSKDFDEKTFQRCTQLLQGL